MPDPPTPSGSRPAASRRDWAPHVRSRLSSLRLSPTREQEIVDELSQHLEERWRELRAGGASEAEATRLALADFQDRDRLGASLAPLKQARMPQPLVPGAATGHVLRDLWQDLRYAMRIRAGRGNDLDATLRACVDVDVVETDAEPPDDAQLRC